jgi:hypothetical protein
MYNSINVEIMTRNELKQLWFSLPVSQKEIKTITVRIGKNKFWPGYGEVTIMSDGPNGYSHFSTHQEHPLQYALDLIKESKGCKYKDYSEYQLIIK